MGQKRGRKRTAIIPPPGQPEGSEIGLHPPSQPVASHTAHYSPTLRSLQTETEVHQEEEQ